MATHVELHVTSHFSFLRGTSSPEELFGFAPPPTGFINSSNILSTRRPIFLFKLKHELFSCHI